MTAIQHTPASQLEALTMTCDAELTLQRAAYMLEQMNGTHVFDLGALLGLLRRGECEDHKPAGHARGVVVKTASAPLNLDPHDAYYRPPFTGHALG